MTHELQLLLILALIILASKLAGHLSHRFLRQPVVFGKIMAGLILGPTVLNIMGWPIFASHGAHGGLQEIIGAIANLGVLLLMFIAGLETDLTKMRQVGRPALWSAVFGVVVPMGAGFITARAFGMPMWESIFIGSVLMATSVSISAQTLMEIGRLQSREGMTIIGAAVIDDIIGIIVLSVVIAFSAMNSGVAGNKLADIIGAALSSAIPFPGSQIVWVLLVIVVLMAVFFYFAISCGMKLFSAIVRRAESFNASHVILSVSLLLMLLFAFSAEYLGQVAAITGAYLAGIFLARTSYREMIEHAVHPFTYALFVPVFFISIGLNANARDCGGAGVALLIAIIIVAVASKIIGCGAGARIAGFSWPESIRVGAGMISRGEVGLIVAQVGLASAVIGKSTYSMVVLMVLATTVVTPVLLRLVFPHEKEEEAEVYESVARIEEDEEEETAPCP